ncbi:hypothetical protein [Alteromonas macleodii]|uniref:Membrane protein n=1 Tax=Alteromonas macleodii TaxID=28108 RepID=A0AB36FMX5_ALTMA|nr:hypothetical protein [Alteromonas macleodii]OES24461.1 putative membrane protein [Alteromonas macleodii]OES25518.1 putative membrane protein [Alteromonas macleodii]OES25821.1 putative membrane protein [Alteromonas macleodii]OES38660.1 putative membrane protein [Alteromonas macleodii]
MSEIKQERLGISLFGVALIKPHPYDLQRVLVTAAVISGLVILLGMYFKMDPAYFIAWAMAGVVPSLLSVCGIKHTDGTKQRNILIGITTAAALVGLLIGHLVF